MGEERGRDFKLIDMSKHSGYYMSTNFGDISFRVCEDFELGVAQRTMCNHKHEIINWRVVVLPS